MKKIIIGGLVALALVGCSTTTTPAPTVTVTQQAPAPTPTPEPVETQSLDDKVVEVARSQGNSYIAGMSDASILNLTSQVCPILDDGVTVQTLIFELASSLVGDGITDPEAMRAVGIILGVAVAAYCPQYGSQVENL